MNFRIDIEKAIQQEESALQSKKVKLQEITRQEEKEKEYSCSLKKSSRKRCKKSKSFRRM